MGVGGDEGVNKRSLHGALIGSYKKRERLMLN